MTIGDVGGEAWVRSVNKQLAELQRTGRRGRSNLNAPTALGQEISPSAEADFIESSGGVAAPDASGDVTSQEQVENELGYDVQEDLSEGVPAEAVTRLNFSPVTPSQPVTESRSGGVAVTWDGYGSGGEAMPVNFLRAEIHRSTEGPEFQVEDLTHSGNLAGAGTYVFNDQEYGVEWWYRLVSLNTDGQRSGASDATVGVAVKVATTDVGFSASEIDFDGVIAANTTAVAGAQADADAAVTAAQAAEAKVADLEIEIADLPTQADVELTAQQKADAAEAAAIAAAALDAQAKADQAEADATAAAALDAQAKADAAAADAEAAAKAYADLQASGAEQSAIDAAALDAQQKADAAEAAAIAAAAADAQAKADAAEAAAIAAAATDAQDRADLAEATAINASAAYVQSRGTDLVTNGSGYLKNATNFDTYFTFNGADAPVGASGSFVDKSTAGGARMIDEVIPYDSSKAYRFAFQMRQTVPGMAAATAYGFVAPIDADGYTVDPNTYIYIAGTQTTLAQPLNPGDTVIRLTSAANWYGSAAKPAGSETYKRAIQFWDYVDGSGKAWAPYTYTRNVLGSNSWADGAVNTTANTITLNVAYNGPARPAGTPVSNSTSGGSYVYMPSLTNGPVPEAWTKFANTLEPKVFPPSSQAVASTGSATWDSGLHAATAKIKVGWLLNYGVAGGRHAVAAVSFSDASAASYAANNITETQITTDAITAPKIKAGAVIAGKLAADAVLANNIKAGEIVAAHMATGTITAASGVIGSLDAAKITVGKIAASQIGAGQITSVSGVIGDLSANHIVTGTLDAALVNVVNLNATSITSGTIDAAVVTVTNIDAAQITTGLISADQIASQAITADKLNSELVLASKLKSSETGRRWEADADGIRVYDVGGNAIVHFPTDVGVASSFTGDLVATSLEVNDHLAIRGIENEVSKGSRLVLSSGVTAPTGAPTMTVEWETFGPSPDPTWDPYKRGFVRYADNYYYTQDVYGSNAQIQRMSSLTGAREYWSRTLTVIRSAYSITNIGGLLYILGQKVNGAWAVEKWNVAGDASAGSWDWDQSWSFSMSNEPAIGTDGTNILIGFTTTSGTVKWRVHNQSTGALMSTVTTDHGGTTRGVMAIQQGNFDYGATRVVMMFKDATEAAGVFTTAGVRQMNDEWPAATGHKARGMTWDATRSEFVAYDPNSAKIVVYTGNKWTTESSTWWGSYTWSNADVSAQTAQSPRKSITMKKRARLRISLPARPTTDSAVTHTRAFLGRGSTDPALTSMFLNGTTTGSSIVVGQAGSSVVWSGAVPPASSSFSTSSPAQIQSGAGNFIVSGDGTGVWGAATFGASTGSDTRFGGDLYVDNNYLRVNLDSAASSAVIGSYTNPNEPALSLMRQSSSGAQSLAHHYLQAGTGTGYSIIVKRDGATVNQLTLGDTGRMTVDGVYMPRMATGTYNTGSIAMNAGTGQINVSFPAGRFTAAPAVFATPGTGRLTPWVANVTTSGFILGFDNFSNAGASAATNYWTAIQY